MRGGGVRKIKVYIATGQCATSEKNFSNLKIWSLSKLINSENQNSNKCTIKRKKLGMRMLKNHPVHY